MVERQEIHCHDCGKYIQFDLDLEIDGNHVLECPVCHHQHCRVVQKGKVSDIRWDARNGADKTKGDKPNPDGCQVLQGEATPDKPEPVKPAPTPSLPSVGPNGLPIIWVPTTSIQWTNQSTYTIYQGNASTGNVYLYQSWMSTTAGTNGGGYGNA